MTDEAVDGILEAVRGRRADAIRGLQQTLPVPQLRSLDAEEPYTGIWVGQALAMTLRQAGDVRGAARLQRGLLEVVLGWDRKCPNWAMTIPTLITCFASAAVDAGLGREVHEGAPAWLEILKGLGDRGHVSDLRLKQVEALLNDGFFERAREALALERPAQLRPDLVPIQRRLAGKIETLLMRPDEPIPPLDAEAVIRSTLDYLRQSEPDAFLTQVLERRGTTELEQGSFNSPAFPPVPKTLESLDQAARGLADSHAPMGALHAVLQGAGAALQAPGNDPETYRQIARIAALAASAADGLGYWEDMVGACWIVTVALRRAGRTAEALERLLALAATIDERRRMIADPRLRAAIAIYLQHLPWVIARTSLAAGDAPAALFGMEMKARILGDLRMKDATRSASPHQLFDGLRRRLAEHPRSHLLTFLVDGAADAATIGEPGILALLLAGDGTVHSAAVPLSEPVVRAVAELIDRLVRAGPPKRRDFGEIFTGDPWRRPFEPHLAILAPLVGWLGPLLRQGVLQTGDTLIYAADGSLHNVPLGMLDLGGAPLIESFALLAMPSLTLALGRMPAATPRRALAVLGPMLSERAAGRGFEDEIATLQTLLPTTVATSIEDAGEALATRTAELLHFATHGTFAMDSPLRRGGLVVQRRNGTYDPYDPDCVLEPEELGASDLAGAHLTMRACLVGQVRQITSREALGAVWSVLSAGAATIAAASWTVEADSAARWCSYFYGAWLTQRQSRAQAHRTACLKLRAEGGAFAHPCHWAPFVLYAGTLEGDVL